jgi:hypothetical protein
MDWKNTSKRAVQHGKTDSHKSYILAMKARENNLDQIDCKHTIHLKENIACWLKALKWTVSTVKDLASRCLSFRGHAEALGPPYNRII